MYTYKSYYYVIRNSLRAFLRLIAGIHETQSAITHNMIRNFRT